MKIIAVILLSYFLKARGDLIASYPDGWVSENPLTNESSLYTPCKSGGYIVLYNSNNYTQFTNLTMYIKSMYDCQYNILNISKNISIAANSYFSQRLNNYSFYNTPNLSLFEFTALGNFTNSDDKGFLVKNNNCLK